jgi:hypothetical protein
MITTIRSGVAVGMLGVNTHIDFANYGYQNLTTVEASINYLGVKNLRDSPEAASDAQTWLQVSQATGAKFDAYTPEGSPANMTASLNLMPQLASEGILNYIEGGNEEDDAYAVSLGNTLQITAHFQQQVWAMGQQLGLSVINMSFGSGWTAANNWQGDYGAVGDLSAYTSYGNAHTYPGVGQGTDWSMQRLNGLAQLAASTRPVITTEIGWDTNAGWTQAQVATNVLQAAMDGMKDGDVKTYFYSLFNDGSGNFGLMNQNGTPTPAGTALHDLTTLLADTGSTASTFTTATLGYTLGGTTTNDNTLLFEKSAGSYWLSLWNENDAAHNVKVTLGSTAAEIKVFAPISGTTAVQDVTNAGSVTLSVGANPELVEVIGAGTAPTTAPPPPPPPPPAPTPSDLTVTVPPTEMVATGTATAVAGVSISDAWAATSPGTMTLNLWDSTGGTFSIAGKTGTSVSINDTLTNLNSDLAGLKYTSAGGQTSDTITVDVWNQAGVEAQQNIGVTVNAPPAPTTITIAPTNANPVVNDSNVTIKATAGNHILFIGGTHDVAILTGGTETVQAAQGYNTITTGSGNDTIRFAGSGNRIDAGAGHNSLFDSGSGNTLVMPGPGQGTDDIVGSVLQIGDKLDFTAALKGTTWDGLAADVGKYLTVSMSNNDAIISMAKTAGGAFSKIADLHASGAVSLQTLLAHSTI